MLELFGEVVKVSTHSRLKAAGFLLGLDDDGGGVSTHSRLKAAGNNDGQSSKTNRSFNTQPPEGGWVPLIVMWVLFKCFNTQPPEGGWKTNGSGNLS